MRFERGWPFSLRDQIEDLRNEASQHGLLRGFPRWVWGQGTRIDEIAEACSTEDRTEPRARHGRDAWNWKLFRGWYHRLTPSFLAGLVVFVAYIWYYLRFFFITTYLTIFLALTPLTALYAIVAVLSLSLTDAFLAGGYTALAYSALQWLRSEDIGIRRLTDRFSQFEP